MGWKNSLTSRQAKYGLNATLYVLAALAIAVIINLIVIRIPTRLGATNVDWQWDLTSNQQFSLSRQAVQVVSKLDRDVELVYFNRRDRFRDMQDLLDQFQAQSRRLRVRYVDPDREPSQATRYNVKEYGVVVVAAGDRTEQAKGTTEEEILNSIIRVLKTGTKTIYFLQGHGEREIDNTERLGYSEAKKALEESNYKIETLSLLQEKPQIPSEAAVLVVAGPQKDLLDPEIAAIKQHMTKGGRVLFLLTPNTPPKLVSLLGEFGADISNNLVVDVSGIGRLFGTDELMPLVLQYENHPITKDMANIATLFPFASAVQASTGSMPGANFQMIAKTTANSWATKDVSSREVSFREGQDLKGPLALAGAGVFHDPSAPEATETRYVVAGSADFVSNAILGFNGNRDLFLNMMAWLSSDEDLISIRPRDPEERTVEMTPEQVRMVLYLSLVVVPLAVVVSGLGVWWRRRG